MALKIVPVNEIPAKVQDVPTDKPMELYKLLSQMQKVCESGGAGLSAVQVGIPLKLFLVNNYKWTPEAQKIGRPENNFEYYLNCEYEPILDAKAIGGNKHESIEGCLSLKNPDGSSRQFLVNRYVGVRIKGKQLVTDPDLAILDIDKEVDGYIAIVFQHEIDHQSGILISEIGQEMEMWQ
jgi:peptide deformylase